MFFTDFVQLVYEVVPQGRAKGLQVIILNSDKLKLDLIAAYLQP